jgi:hypothetical protein
MSRPRSTQALLKKGYLPRVLMARRLRRLADGVEKGDGGDMGLYIRTPESDPDLWVKLPTTLYYEHFPYDEDVEAAIAKAKKKDIAKKPRTRKATVSKAVTA